MDVSLQLYSIKDETKKDFQAAVQRVGRIGYKGVEFAGYGGLSAEEMSALLKASGLYAVGSHVGLPAFEGAFEQELAFNKAVGSEYIICPYAKTDTREEVDRLVQLLNDAAGKAAGEHIKIGYHNHAHEFVKIDGQYPLDIIAENTAENVILEVDIFWAAYAGVDPIEYIRKWGKKVELIHIKQIDANKANVDIPDGILDIGKVKAAAVYAKYFILEHEEYDKPVWESIERDYAGLNAVD